MELFKKRMFNKFNLVEKKIDKSNIKIAFIDNKRFLAQERIVIDNLIKYFIENRKEICIEYINWSEYNSFKDQLEKTSDIDIYITGPGTSMLNMPFLKNGAVNINVGYMSNEHYSNMIIPGYMEQNVCASAKYVSTLYYDRKKYNELEYDPLLSLIENAILKIKQNIISENNLNDDALVFIEYCKRVDNSDLLCHYLTEKHIFINMLIYEDPILINNCDLINLNILREVKKDLNFNY